MCLLARGGATFDSANSSLASHEAVILTTLSGKSRGKFLPRSRERRRKRETKGVEECTERRGKLY